MVVPAPKSQLVIIPPPTSCRQVVTANLRVSTAGYSAGTTASTRLRPHVSLEFHIAGVAEAAAVVATVVAVTCVLLVMSTAEQAAQVGSVSTHRQTLKRAVDAPTVAWVLIALRCPV